MSETTVEGDRGTSCGCTEEETVGAASSEPLTIEDVEAADMAAADAAEKLLKDDGV